MSDCGTPRQRRLAPLAMRGTLLLPAADADGDGAFATLDLELHDASVAAAVQGALAARSGQKRRFTHVDDAPAWRSFSRGMPASIRAAFCRVLDEVESTRAALHGAVFEAFASAAGDLGLPCDGADGLSDAPVLFHPLWKRVHLDDAWDAPVLRRRWGVVSRDSLGGALGDSLGDAIGGGDVAGEFVPLEHAALSAALSASPGPERLFTELEWGALGVDDAVRAEHVVRADDGRWFRPFAVPVDLRRSFDVAVCRIGERVGAEVFGVGVNSPALTGLRREARLPCSADLAHRVRASPTAAKKFPARELGHFLDVVSGDALDDDFVLRALFPNGAPADLPSPSQPA